MNTKYTVTPSSPLIFEMGGPMSVGNRLSRAAWEMLDPQEKRDFITNGGIVRE